MTVGERIKNRRKRLGLSVDDLAKKLGKNRATVYRYESDEIENLPLNILEPLAKALGVTPAYLMGWENIHPYETKKTKKVPMLGEIAAGEPLYVAEERCEYYVEVDDSLHIDFCLRVKGDSMIDARINDGDVVFIRKQPIVDNGEIAAVIIDNEVTLKRFYKNSDGVILKPENPRYQPRFYTAKDFKDIRILGKAIFFQSNL
ncbi:transcriptional repressor LexA [Desulfofalx alkaliphila]|uniref:transcriptional repressor LexA n=1 Tax=Desulfofalx alkaliphila TaxID=105483 RepID=UPI0004E23FAD|nr:transcriptional repressor LexA [Desulfofalx alkaliphila]